jgi:NAD(P)-dependent dehydrogenase (short-subunit alcohol dehydrogenase family)
MPGPFLTDISKAWDLRAPDRGASDRGTSDSAASEWADSNPFGRHPLQRAGDPAEIVGAALFLMSDASSFTTGSILRADGGLPG